MSADPPVTRPDLDALISDLGYIVRDRRYVLNARETAQIEAAAAALVAEQGRADRWREEALDAAEASGWIAISLGQAEWRIASIQALHRPKWGANEHGSYVICDYDKTEWPCRTEGILSAAPTAK